MTRPDLLAACVLLLLLSQSSWRGECLQVVSEISLPSVETTTTTAEASAINTTATTEKEEENEVDVDADDDGYTTDDESSSSSSSDDEEGDSDGEVPAEIEELISELVNKTGLDREELAEALNRTIVILKQGIEGREQQAPRGRESSESSEESEEEGGSESSEESEEEAKEPKKEKKAKKKEEKAKKKKDKAKKEEKKKEKEKKKPAKGGVSKNGQTLGQEGLETGQGLLKIINTLSASKSLTDVVRSCVARLGDILKAIAKGQMSAAKHTLQGGVKGPDGKLPPKPPGAKKKGGMRRVGGSSGADGGELQPQEQASDQAVLIRSKRQTVKVVRLLVQLLCSKELKDFIKMQAKFAKKNYKMIQKQIKKQQKMTPPTPPPPPKPKGR